MINPQNWQVIELIVVVLASYRLTVMLLEEDGFLSIAFAVRLLMGFKVEGMTKFVAWKLSLNYDSDELEPVATGHFGRLFSCFYCLSVWTGVLMPIAYCLLNDTPFVILFYGLAISAIGIFLERIRG